MPFKFNPLHGTFDVVDGDVYGPASSTDNAIARFDTTTGKLIQDSNVIVDDTYTGAFKVSTLFSTSLGNIPAIEIDGTIAAATAQWGAGIIFNSDYAKSAFYIATADIATADGTSAIYMRTGIASGAAASGEIDITTGNSTTSGRSGDLYLGTGSAPAGSLSGDVYINTGVSSAGYGSIILGVTGGPRPDGAIKFQNGSEGTSGYVWRSTATDGSGSWLAPNLEPVITVTAASTTLDATHCNVLCDSSSNAVTIDLPAAASHTGRVYSIKAIDVTNGVTVDGNGSETIDGSLTQVLPLNATMKIISNGTGWFII